MIESKKEFLIQFQELLEKFEVDMTASDHYQGYPECGQDIKITLSSPDWNYRDIEMGYIDSDVIKSLLNEENQQEREG